MKMSETMSFLTFFGLFMLIQFCVWATSEAQGLEANCSVPADGHGIQEFSLCQCDHVKHLNCYGTWHIVIVDVVLGTISGSYCTSSSTCSTSIVYEYKMSEHCNDNQFLDILEPCNGRLNCHIYHYVYESGAARNLTYNGSVVPADYTTVRYRCIQNTYTARFDVCGSERMPSTGTLYTYLTSPGFPIPSSRSKQHKLCCCSLTGVNDLYLLHYDKRTTNAPLIMFGINNTGRFETVDFQNKIANVHIGTHKSDTYYLTWRQTGTTDSGVFMASIKGTSSMTVRCGTSGCPVGHLPPLSTNIPTATSFSSGKPDTTAGATIPTSGGSAAQKDDRLPVPMIAGVVVGALVLIAFVIIAVVLLRRRRRSQKEPDNMPDEIYAQPSKKGDGSNAFTSPSAYELQQPPVPTKSPNITDAEGDYTYVETPDVVQQSTPDGNAVKKPLISKKPQRLAPVYDDADAGAYQTVDEEISANGVPPTAANKQNEPAYQEYGEVYQGSKPDGDSAPYQEYDASEAAEDYAYADRYRPTKIIQQVQNNPPALVSDYETGSSYTYAAVDKE